MSPGSGSPAACAQPRNQYLMAFGEFMARHARREPTDRFAPPELRTIEIMNRNLRADVTNAAEHIDPARVRFLEPDETLRDGPKTWDQAVCQRAEWTLALDAITHGLADRARGNRLRRQLRGGFVDADGLRPGPPRRTRGS